MSNELLKCGVVLVFGTLGASASLLFVGPTMFGGNATSFPTVLTIQNDRMASGCVAFMAGTDVSGLAACPGGFTGSGGNEVSGQTATHMIAELRSAGITDASKLLFVFRPDEPGGGALSLQDLALTFFDASTDASFTATLPCRCSSSGATRPSCSR